MAFAVSFRHKTRQERREEGQAVGPEKPTPPGVNGIGVAKKTLLRGSSSMSPLPILLTEPLRPAPDPPTDMKR